MRGAGAPKTLYHQLFTALKGRPLGEAAETDRTGNLPKLPAPQPRLQNVLTARLPAPPHAMGCPRALPTHLSPLPRSLGSEQTGGAKPRAGGPPTGWVLLTTSVRPGPEPATCGAAPGSSEPGGKPPGRPSPFRSLHKAASVLEPFRGSRPPELPVKRGILCSCREQIFGGLTSSGLPLVKQTVVYKLCGFHPGSAGEGSEGTAPPSPPQRPALGS